MATERREQMKEAIRLAFGVECPNPAGERSLDDVAALAAEFAALRDSMVFEDEPSTFEAALRAERERDS